MSRPLKERAFWDVLWSALWGNDLWAWMEWSQKEKNKDKSIEDFREEKEIKTKFYSYRDAHYWKYNNPNTERISKVFPKEYREFDNVIWLWHDSCTWFFSEETLQEYIDKWLYGKIAMDHYDAEVSRVMWRKK